MFKIFKPKIKSSKEIPKDVIQTSKQSGPYRASEIRDTDELMARREKFQKIGKFEYVSRFEQEGVVIVKEKKNKKMWLIDKDGSKVSEKFDIVYPFRDDIARVGLFVGGKWKGSFINHLGERIVEKWFDFAYSFSEGLAAVKQDGKWFFINNNGVKVIDEEFDDVEIGFKNGI